MTSILVVAATVLTGLSAGLFATFGYAVMPGLRRTDDAVFVQAMRAVNVAILNPVFAVVFGGAFVVSVAAVVASWGTSAAPWLLASTLLYVVGAFVVTGVVNVPLNDALAEGDEVRSLRAAFERRWVASNHVRSALTTVALVCAAIGATHV
ncbi:DUF1772 domain-containing protein [Aeromicrobium sp. Root472D3]|uniref:anthrone oxygenase family protein n=1 Tax=Aeromicrobium sp. Root472D3 TaxID=1736540 RepID=UPI0006F1F955|nr:anthrone oxygenase family protein [Aeromicrobium sp. Root472D3]KQX74960.1 hypothetical protein ASD10_07045 [Aeromicrobium sp. Root472D3]